MKRRSGGGRSRRDIILETWMSLGRGPVSAKTVGKIQHALSERFGPGGMESPASIARLLADEGADLRHPDIIECDARWREAKLNEVSGNGIILDPDRPLTLRVSRRPQLARRPASIRVDRHRQGLKRLARQD